MFGGLFGVSKKNSLIRELLELRMRSLGFSDINEKLKIKQMGTFKLMSTPEATLVVILDTIIVQQSRGLLLVDIIKSIEGQRKRMGSDYIQFNEILRLAVDQDSGAAVLAYCCYRLDIEHYGVMDVEDVGLAISEAAPVILNW